MTEGPMERRKEGRKREERGKDRLIDINKILVHIKKIPSVPWGFPSGSETSLVVHCISNVGDTSSIPGLVRSPGEGNGTPLQYSCLEIPWTEEPGGLQSMGPQKSQTRLSP